MSEAVLHCQNEILIAASDHASALFMTCMWLFVTLLYTQR